MRRKDAVLPYISRIEVVEASALASLQRDPPHLQSILRLSGLVIPDSNLERITGHQNCLHFVAAAKALHNNANSLGALPVLTQDVGQDWHWKMTYCCWTPYDKHC